MKSKFIILTATLLSISLLAGCGPTETASNAEVQTPETSTESTATAEQTPEPTEEPHTHNYAEEITTEATCEADGLKTFTCECGDSYAEAIAASGHIYENYVYNEDATYLADGTETAKCNTCDLTDTRTAEGSKLEYTYTEMNATMYATQTVNVRNLPNTDGEKIGSLSTNQEITVIGQCVETSWYMFDYEGQTAFVSNNYLSTEKVEVAPPAQESAQTTSNVPNPYDYPVDTWVDMGDWMFYVHPALESPEPNVNGALWENARATLQARYPDSNISGRSGMKLDNGTYSVWMVAVGGTHSYDYPKSMLDFIATYQY